jgi:aryl-alcohol dehydrogenase-like predicted oxidoreductase
MNRQRREVKKKKKKKRKKKKKKKIVGKLNTVRKNGDLTILERILAWLAFKSEIEDRDRYMI